MHPVLFKLGPLAIHTYGFFIALGFLAAIFISKREAVLQNENPEIITDLLFWILIAAIVGSRFFYIVVNWNDFFPDNLMSIFKIWEGGLVFYGGFIGAAIVSIIYLKKHKIPVWKAADILAPSLPFGHFLGRLGCFSAGCCYGKSCSLPWSVTFSNPESLAPLGQALHPTQLYSSAANLLLFVFLINYKRYKKFDGQVFFTYMVLYAIIRSIIEVFRGDYRGTFSMGELSVAQTIAICLCVFASGMMIYLYKRSKKQ
jgi:phosphatidylglycerol:prolipoprotein diacylglycerol transferase